MPALQRYTLYLHVLALLIVIGSGAALVLVPGGQAISAQLSGSSIDLRVDRRMVFAAGDCVRVEWRVEGVREVYFDGSPTIGEAAQQVCLTTETTPVLRAVLPDGSANDYRIPIPFFIHQPAALFLALIAALIVLSFAALLVLPRLTRVSVVPTAARSGCLSRGLMIVGALTLLFVAAAGVLELVLRGVFTTYGTESDRLSYVYTREEAAARDTRPLALPFIEYGLNPAHEGYNAFGMRGADVTPDKPEGVYRIITMGDSSTFGATDDGEAYADWLGRILRDDYGLTHVEVINAGVHGYSSWNMLANFEFRLLELQPDLVIVFQTVFDLTARTANPDCYRGINPLRGLSPISGNATNYNEGTFSVSTLYRYVTINLGLERDPAADESNSVPVNVACGDGRIYSDADAYALNPPVYYERNLRSLIGVAQIHGVNVLISAWAYDRANTGLELAWRAAVAEQNEIARRLAAEYELPFVDYAALAPEGGDVWADPLHLNGAGSRHQAEVYAAYLVEQGVIAPY
jgi:hypothetical protein